MRNSIKLGLAVLALGAFTSNALAQNDQTDNITRILGGCSSCSSASATTTVWARVITPISVTATEEMNFGAFCVNGANGGTATIAPDKSSNAGQGGTITYAGLQPINALNLANDGDGPEEARFQAKGEPTLQYTTSVTGTISGTGVSIGLFTVNGPGAYGSGSGVAHVANFPASGSQDIDVGATLFALPTASIGLHSGTVTMTVAY